MTEQTVLFGAADAHVHAVRILSVAQVTADKYVADAQDYSSRLTEETRLRRDEIMQEAQQYSDRLLEDAHAKAREAAVSALNVATAPQSDEQQRAAQAELAYLRTYSDVYRAHLRAYTEGILRGIEEWERKETASLQEAAQAGQLPGSGKAGQLPGRGRLMATDICAIERMRTAARSRSSRPRTPLTAMRRHTNWRADMWSISAVTAAEIGHFRVYGPALSSRPPAY